MASYSWSLRLRYFYRSSPSHGFTAKETFSFTVTRLPTSTLLAASLTRATPAGINWFRLAASASSACRALRRQRPALAHRRWRLHPLHAGLCSRSSRNLPPRPRTRTSAAPASLAAAIYAFNPSLLYMQSTAMTESIYLATVIWAMVYFDDFLRGLRTPGVRPEPAVGYTAAKLGEPAPTVRQLPASLPAWRAIERCGCCLAAAIFTRYDGWIVAFIVGICAAMCALRGISTPRPRQETRRLFRALCISFLSACLVPHCCGSRTTTKSIGHPLDWLNGPYSAKAIEKRSARRHGLLLIPARITWLLPRNIS